jgi:hypothetical protein
MYLLSGWGQRTVEMRRFDSDGSDEGGRVEQPLAV